MDEIVRATMERLVSSSMEPGQDPDDCSMEETVTRSEVERMDEPVSTGRSRTVTPGGPVLSRRYNYYGGGIVNRTLGTHKNLPGYAFTFFH